MFFAAVALRQTERKLTLSSHEHTDNHPPTGIDEGQVPTVSAGSLVFKEHLERLSELTLVLMLGGTLFINSWSWEAVGLALFVFLLARPVSVLVGLWGTGTARLMRLLTTFSASMFIHRTQDDAARVQDCFILADDASFVRRPVAAQPRGVFVTNDANEASVMRKRFEEIWNSSTQVVSATVSGL